jgi:uncharacterized protein
MLIRVADLQQGRKRFAKTYAPGDLPLGDERAELSGPLAVEAVASLRGTEVVVQGTIAGNLGAACDRCLQPIPFPISLSFDSHFIPVTDYEENERAELQEEDLDFSVFDGETIDLDELIREQILLTLPVRLLCGEECRGLCAECGKDLNAAPCGCREEQIDPRWGTLAALKKTE